ncbi:MAG: magnesium transporter [Pirellulales bacterium]
MVNTLFLPEIREMLAENNDRELQEFCTALHPARTAEFMEGLEPQEAWAVLQHAERSVQSEIFHYFEWDRKVELLAEQDPLQVAKLLTALSADDAVDLLQELPSERVEELLALVPATDRRDIRKLQSFAEGTAGSLMTTEAACLDETLSVKQALEQLSRQAEHLETVYYIYVTDDNNRLKGVVNTRRLVSAIGRSDTRLGEIMETDLVVCHVGDDQEAVAQKVARYNLLAIPVVDSNRHMMGIITHDDVIDVMVEEATEDVQRIAAVEPLSDSYMRTSLWTLSWKRGMWLTILFFAELITAFVLKFYDRDFEMYRWLVFFIPLIISSGGNSGSQSSTLIITSLAKEDAKLSQWKRIVLREFGQGLLLGTFLGFIGFFCAIVLAPTVHAAMVIPLTILAIVIFGTFIGSILPMLFRRIGWDPALMSNPFVAGIIDISGIIIYINIAMLIL